MDGKCPSLGGAQLHLPCGGEGLGIHPLRQADPLGPEGQGIEVITTGLDPAVSLQFPADGPQQGRLGAGGFDGGGYSRCRGEGGAVAEIGGSLMMGLDRGIRGGDRLPRREALQQLQQHPGPVIVAQQLESGDAGGEGHPQRRAGGRSSPVVVGLLY